MNVLSSAGNRFHGKDQRIVIAHVIPTCWSGARSTSCETLRVPRRWLLVAQRGGGFCSSDRPALRTHREQRNDERQCRRRNERPRAKRHVIRKFVQPAIHNIGSDRPRDQACIEYRLTELP